MSLTSAFQASADRNPGKTAVAFGADAWSFSEFHRASRNLAVNLLAAGAEPGDRVALHLLNGLELALAVAGCLKAGFIVVPLNTRLKGREIDYILRHSGSAFYIGEPQLCEEIAHSCPALEELSGHYLTGPVSESVRSFDDLLRTPTRDGSLPCIPAEETAAIMYTSGTTAHPKGVVHTHGTLFETTRTVQEMDLDEDEVLIVMSSMAHMVGLAMSFLSALAIGATTVITRPFDFEGALNAYERWHGTYTMTLPVVLQCLLRLQTQAPRDLSSADPSSVAETASHQHYRKHLHAQSRRFAKSTEPLKSHPHAGTGRVRSARARSGSRATALNFALWMQTVQTPLMAPWVRFAFAAHT